MDSTVSTHRRSHSDAIKRRGLKDELDNILEGSYPPNMESIEFKRGKHHDMDRKNSLTKEILHLQKRLRQQFVVRRALEKACYLPFTQDPTLENSMPEAAKELIKEIGVLEMEVGYLEQHLLSLYRKRFDQQLSSLSAKERSLKSVIDADKETHEVPRKDGVSQKEISVPHSYHLVSPRNSVGLPLKKCSNNLKPEMVLDSSIHRCHSTLSQRSICLIEPSHFKVQSKAVDYYHSLPLSVLERAQRSNSNKTCLAEHLGNCFSDNVLETPNWVSEEMIKCMSTIYCELADLPSLAHDNAYASSPISVSSSVDDFSSQGQRNKRGSWHKKHSSFNLHFNPFHINVSKEFSGPYSAMVKIQRLCRDRDKLKEVEYMLRRYRSLVSRLENFDPRNMKHEQKLAFWINVHNALVMHALLVYGIPANSLKRMSLVVKAAYNIGGHTVSVDAIQNIILGCKLPRPGQWLRFLFPSKTKSNVRDARKAYALHRPEPLVIFGLCSGGHSDPAVHLYTSKRVFKELESAKDEYILSNISITKEHKILVPKIVDIFARNSGLGPAGLMEMVKPYVSDYQKKAIQKFQPKANWKSTELIPHRFTFHYLLSKELTW